MPYAVNESIRNIRRSECKATTIPHALKNHCEPTTQTSCEPGSEPALPRRLSDALVAVALKSVIP